MKSIVTVILIVAAFSQTLTLTLTPTTTPMGSSMFAYPVSFPNSDPKVVAQPDRLAYLITAIACISRASIYFIYPSK